MPTIERIEIPTILPALGWQPIAQSSVPGRGLLREVFCRMSSQSQRIGVRQVMNDRQDQRSCHELLSDRVQEFAPKFSQLAPRRDFAVEHRHYPPLVAHYLVPGARGDPPCRWAQVAGHLAPQTRMAPCTQVASLQECAVVC